MTEPGEAGALGPSPPRGYRIGQGFDVHAFADDRPLILGGVRIELARGLAGHSDGDVLLHAVADALLGAAGLEDIGRRFPSADERYRNAPSRLFLESAREEIARAGWRVVNLDATVVAQEPRLMPHLEAIRQTLAHLSRLDLGAVSVKAKTTDHLGAIGRGEGIAALAIALLEPSDQPLLSSDL